MASARMSTVCCFRGLESVWRGIVLGAVVLGASYAFCQPAMPDYQIKAAFLYHFTQFVEWPAEVTSGSFVICVAGDAALRSSLESLSRGKSVGSRPIQVKPITAPEQAHMCHLVFLSSSLNMKAPRYLAAVHALDVLTVGEPPGFRERGGMIELFLEDSRIRFDVNEQALREAHLRASSRLLRLARRIDPAASGGTP
jgi:hypothetical protein